MSGARHVVLPYAVGALVRVESDASGPARVVVSNGPTGSLVDLATGLSTPVPIPRAERKPPIDPSLLLAPLRDVLRETATGPITEIVDPSAGGAVLGAIPGQIVDVRREGSLLVAMVASPGPRFDVVALALGTGAREMRLPGSQHTKLACDGTYAAAATGPVLHLFRRSPEGLASLSLAMPEVRYGDAVIDGGYVLSLAEESLFVLRLDALPFAPGRHQAIAMRYETVVAHAAGLARPGTVAALVGAKILVDHPDVGRVIIERKPADPTAKAGDVVFLLDVREPLPGVRKVHAWRIGESGPASVVPVAAPRELAAPAVAPIAVAVGAPKRPLENARAMREIFESFGLRIPPALDAFLEATDADPVLRRWLTALGLDDVDVRPMVIDWDGDPLVVAFGGRGNGDGPAVYLYPPACRDAEPVIVELLHETNELELLALTFADFLEGTLQRASETHADIVQRVRDRLGLAPRALPALGAPPPWLPLARAPAPSAAQIEALERAGDLLAAERGWSARWTKGSPPDHAAFEALVRTYEALGWHGAAMLARRRNA